MSIEFAGIHHVTAIAGDPQENVDFYVGILGLRLVKKTVNFDDPESYHLYYGDALGSPGTIITFFSWPDALRGRIGTGQVTSTSFAVPEGSLGYWTERLIEHGVRFEQPEKRFGETVVAFKDPDGLVVELVAGPDRDSGDPREEGPVPPEHAIRCISGVTLSERWEEASANFLTNLLGFEKTKEGDERARYLTMSSGGSFADVLERPDGSTGRTAVGTVHHVAWRAPDEETQKAWREEISAHGFEITPVLDRQYFRSVYFREPGGVLFEIATDPPGFTVDETKEHLGENLKLPPWLEKDREHIEQVLPPIHLPQQKG
ncbi:MAG TPA: ring-cleaving dioxygenase [Rubrobacteraceae bacterium]|nr:ring-cleaving dioxygenase [Rubrobacteraceae bacterium]